MTAVADLCELALRQVPKYTGHTDGDFVEGTKVGSWPTVACQQLQTRRQLGSITAFTISFSNHVSHTADISVDSPLDAGTIGANNPVDKEARKQQNTERHTKWHTGRTTQTKKPLESGASLLYLAERAGFEPAVGYYPTHAFQACDLNHSSISPKERAF